MHQVLEEIGIKIGDVIDEGCSDTVTKLEVSCQICNLFFKTRDDLFEHINTDRHKSVTVPSAYYWKGRDEPSTISDQLCDSYSELTKVCTYGRKCARAHCFAELKEWKDRAALRYNRSVSIHELVMFNPCYREDAERKRLSNPKFYNFIKEVRDERYTACYSENRPAKYNWQFVMYSKYLMTAVELVTDKVTNTNFELTRIKTTKLDGTILLDATPAGDKTSWTISRLLMETDISDFLHYITIKFSKCIYGTFSQLFIFEFGCTLPLVLRTVTVDVTPSRYANTLQEIRSSIKPAIRWINSDFVSIVPFNNEFDQLTLRERNLLDKYKPLTPDNFIISSVTIISPKLTNENYCEVMHQLLCVEEKSQSDLISTYNIQSEVILTDRYETGGLYNTANYALSNELIMIITLAEYMSEDTASGRLILNKCNRVLFSPLSNAPFEYGKRLVFEGIITYKGRRTLYIKIDKEATEPLGWRVGSVVEVDMQFQLNRIPFCEWHWAIDSIPDLKHVLPNLMITEEIPKDIQAEINSRSPMLNKKQKEALVLITATTDPCLPPILVLGSYGTGKTYTLALAIHVLLEIPTTRILVCTHSNSAADLYVKEYLHPLAVNGFPQAAPLRIYYAQRRITTVNPIVLQYCITKNVCGAVKFTEPTKEDVEKHRIVVVTLSTSGLLASLNLKPDHFTHIFVDEAAQALECEVLTPLSLAGPETRVILAGDHLQCGPEIYSSFAKARNFDLSILERLFDYYPSNAKCKIMLTENYRSHKAIVKFTAEAFYTKDLKSCGIHFKHPQFYPLTFFAAQGEDILSPSSASYYNLSEVYQVIDCVKVVRESWPIEWGEFDDSSIGVLTPYAEQVMIIRNELRNQRLSGVTVERVQNVQGKQYRVVVISAVRSRRSCNGPIDGREYGFLSDKKILNTAITRAQSLVIAVGDPIALCTIGDCSEIWQRYLETCHKNDSVYGIDFERLKNWLDSNPNPKSNLSPFAMEFVPNAERFPLADPNILPIPQLMDLPFHHEPINSVQNIPAVHGPYFSTGYPPVSNMYPYPSVVPHMFPPVPSHLPPPLLPGITFRPSLLPFPNSFPSNPYRMVAYQTMPYNSMPLNTIVQNGVPANVVGNNYPMSGLQIPQNELLASQQTGNFNTYASAVAQNGLNNNVVNPNILPPGLDRHGIPLLKYSTPIRPGTDVHIPTVLQNGRTLNGIVNSVPQPIVRPCIPKNTISASSVGQQKVAVDKKITGPEDWSDLLPLNHSLVELLTDKKKQDEWYDSLMTFDVEKASRFKNLIDQACSKSHVKNNSNVSPELLLLASNHVENDAIPPQICKNGSKKQGETTAHSQNDAQEVINNLSELENKKKSDGKKKRSFRSR